MALLLALVALGVAGSFVAAAFFAARMAGTADRLAQRTLQLQGITDIALAQLLQAWDAARWLRQPVGTSQAAGEFDVDAGARTRGWITRVSGRTFLVTIRATDRADTTVDAGAAHLVRVDSPRFPGLAALVARGDVRIDGVLQSSADDSADASGCGSTAAAVPGILVPPGRTGPPTAVEGREAGVDSTYLVFGTSSLESLVRGATLELGAGAAVPAPAALLAHAAGDLELVGGSGRGILIVDGRLRVTGAVSYRGVIVASGGLEVSAAGVTVDGLILSASNAIPSVLVKANADLHLRYSFCAVEDAVWPVGRLRSVAPRGWAPAS
ncbi:MAG: hypothetical protein ACYCVL_13990 [Gemmatimonadaceae bacterium]